MSHLQSPYGAAGVGAASSQHALVGPGTSAKHLSNSTPGGYAYDEPTPELPAEKAYEMSDAADPNWHDAATRGPNAPGSGKKLLWTLLGVTLAIVVIAAVVVGAVLGTRKPNEDDASSSGNSSKSVSSDPSNFEKDSRLHNSFYG